MAEKLRVIVAKPGLDGHDRGAKVVARALRDAGFEVIYTGLFQTPEQIAEAAIQEDADAVGLSCHSGAHMTLFPKVVKELRARGADDVVVVAGGVIPADDIPKLKEAGIEAVFTPGREHGRHRVLAPRSARGEGLAGAARDPHGWTSTSTWARTCSAPMACETPRGIVAFSPTDAASATDELGGRSVVKIQVQVGGRGKGGGVELCDTPEAAAAAAGRMLGSDFKGFPVTRVLVEELLPIAREFYTSLLLDRARGDYLAMMTAEGGVDIEELARTRPEALRRVHIDPMLGLRAYHVRELIGTLPVEAWEGAADALRKMYELLVERDATLVEVNPLVLLEDDRVVALDAKVTIDDNALWRHPDIAELAEQFPIDEVEARAKEKGLQYVKLDGDVGIIGNGAGLVMSTLDVVAQAGARAANFLDVGGGASADQMATSLEVVLSDPAVKVVLVNIFGGITRVRPRRPGHPGGAGAGRGPRPHRRPARRDQCRGRASDPRGRRASQDRPRREHARGGRGGRRPRGGAPVSILVDERTTLVVQGITGNEGTFHTLRNRDYGTNVVAGVTPGKGGQDVEGIPVFDTVARAVAETGADTSMIFVPPRFAAEAILEAADAGRRSRRVHHRGDPRPRHGERPQLPRGVEDAGSSGPTAPA